jgi:hypothetical protein
MEICREKAQNMQEVITYIIVATAVFLLIRRFYLIFNHKKKAGCADCGAADIKKTPVKD